MLKRNNTAKWEQILLVLDNWSVRDIWHIRNWVYYTKRDPNKHLFHKTNSYFFNRELLNQLPRDTKILVDEKWYKYHLKTTVEDILKENDYKYFKLQWFELQVSLNRDRFDIEPKK